MRRFFILRLLLVFINSYFLGLLFVGSYTTCSAPSSSSIKLFDSGDGTRREAMKLLIAVSPENDDNLLAIAQILAGNLERSGQFRVAIKSFKTPTTQAELRQILDREYPLEVFLSHEDDLRSIAWRLYDVHDASLIKGMKYKKRGTNAHGYADNLADELWPILTKQASSFSSKIAYVKRKKTTSKRQRSVVCVSHTDGSHEHEIIKTPGTYVSLYWHHDKKRPCLFCSEFTRYNVRLISANLQGKKHIVLNLKGTCVGISVAHDNARAVYCRSGTIYLYCFDPIEKKGVHTPIIKNEGKNVSPTLLDNGDVIFCSDAPSLLKKHGAGKGPHICYYSAADKSIRPLTSEGYCVGPSYCPLNRKIAFSKKIHGVMQLFTYDMRTKEPQQLTFDEGNKIDCCWSPCGNFLVFCYQQGNESRISLMHVAMRKRSFLTPHGAYCSSPSWSPVFE